MDVTRPAPAFLLETWERTVASALEQLAATPGGVLTERRPVGRAQLLSTVHGLLFHAAEHAARHTGQIVTTARLLATMKCSTGGRRVGSVFRAGR